MILKAELIEARMKNYQEEHTRFVSEAKMLEGAIADCKYWLSEIAKEEPEGEEKESEET